MTHRTVVRTGSLCVSLVSGSLVAVALAASAATVWSLGRPPEPSLQLIASRNVNMVSG